jgi:hypothetical protein
MGILELMLGALPVFGGALLGITAGQLKGPNQFKGTNFRDTIKQDLALLGELPPDQQARRAELQRTIDQRIDDLVKAEDRARAMRAAATEYKGNWRDIVFFVCSVLFTYIWVTRSHHGHSWLPLLIALVILCVITGAYAFHGAWQALKALLRRHSR